MRRIDELLRAAEQQLADFDSARLDAEVLLAWVLGKPRSYLRAWPEVELDSHAIKEYLQLLARRCAGEPISHLTGEREFWSLSLQVSPDTLIPRPDTELLVAEALTCLPDSDHVRIADLGTGSGAVAIALASECPRCQVIATDLSTAALALAQANAKRLKQPQIHFLHSNWCSAFARSDRFDVIVSNPPYIPTNDPHLRSAELAFEPQFALTSGEDGLDAIRLITAQAADHLVPSGWLLVEHGYDQGEAVRQLFIDNGYETVTTCQDLAGHDRVCRGQKPA